jgi:hypothetical protein
MKELHVVDSDDRSRPTLVNERYVMSAFATAKSDRLAMRSALNMANGSTLWVREDYQEIKDWLLGREREHEAHDRESDMGWGR